MAFSQRYILRCFEGSKRYWPARIWEILVATAPRASFGFRSPIVDREDEELGARKLREHHRKGVFEVEAGRREEKTHWDDHRAHDSCDPIVLALRKGQYFGHEEQEQANHVTNRTCRADKDVGHLFPFAVDEGLTFCAMQGSSICKT